MEPRGVIRGVLVKIIRLGNSVKTLSFQLKSPEVPGEYDLTVLGAYLAEPDAVTDHVKERVIRVEHTHVSLVPLGEKTGVGGKLSPVPVRAIRGLKSEGGNILASRFCFNVFASTTRALIKHVITFVTALIANAYVIWLMLSVRLAQLIVGNETLCPRPRDLETNLFLYIVHSSCYSSNSSGVILGSKRLSTSLSFSHTMPLRLPPASSFSEETASGKEYT